MKKTLALASLLVLAFTVPAKSQETKLPRGDQSAVDYINEIRQEFESDDDTLQKMAEVTADATEEAVEASTSSAGVAEGFADRVNDTLADFLPLFQFAVDAVSTAEDEESVTLKFNPVLTGRGALAFQASIFEPAVYQPLLDAILEPVREAQQKAIEDAVGDFGDVSVTATWGLQKSDRGVNWGEDVRLWGRGQRASDQYGRLVEDLAISLLKPAFEQTQAQRNRANTDWGNLLVALSRELNPPGTAAADRIEVNKITLGEIRKMMGPGGRLAGRGFDIDTFIARLVAYGESLRALYQELNRQPLIDGIAPLLDNQPQLTVSVSYRTRDELVGPNHIVGNVKWELGSKNLNAVLREYRLLKKEDPSKSHEQLVRAAFEEVTAGDKHLSQDKYTFSFTYRYQEDYRPSYDYTQTVTVADPSTDPMDQTILRTANPEAVEATDDFSLRFLWTRRIRRGGLGLAGPVADVLPATKPLPQLSLSIEWDIVDVDNPHRQSRLIGRLGYTLPLPGGMSLPFTLTYADRSEFLGEQDEVFGAHVGLSYKLPIGGS